MNTQVMFSSQIDNWATPQELFDGLNKEFSFTIDVCANCLISRKALSFRYHRKHFLQKRHWEMHRGLTVCGDNTFEKFFSICPL